MFVPSRIRLYGPSPMPVRCPSRPQVKTPAKRQTRQRWLAPLLLGGSLLLAGPRAMADGEPASVRVQTLVKSTEAWNGTPLPAYPSGEPEVTVLHITIPPG